MASEQIDGSACEKVTLKVAAHARCLLALLFSLAAGSSAIASDAMPTNHAYNKVVIGYASDGCSFQYAPIDFCDAPHLDAIRKALVTRKPDFNQHYIVVAIPERKEYFQRSVVVIDALTGNVYPVPIDFYSGPTGNADRAKAFGKLQYSLGSDSLCIDGAIYAAHEQHDGHFCFVLRQDRFTGPRTPYTDT